MQSTRFLAGALALAAAFAGACAHDDNKAPEAPKTLTAADYYPLAVGHKWTYRPEPAPQGTPDQVIEVTGRDADGFFVTNGGSRLSHRREGVFDGDRFILQEPLKPFAGIKARDEGSPISSLVLRPDRSHHRIQEP